MRYELRPRELLFRRVHQVILALFTVSYVVCQTLAFSERTHKHEIRELTYWNVVIYFLLQTENLGNYVLSIFFDTYEIEIKYILNPIAPPMRFNRGSSDADDRIGKHVGGKEQGKWRSDGDPKNPETDNQLEPLIKKEL